MLDSNNFIVIPSEKRVGRVVTSTDVHQLVVLVRVVMEREQERIDHEIGGSLFFGFFLFDRAVHRRMASCGSNRSRDWCID